MKFERALSHGFFYIYSITCQENIQDSQLVFSRIILKPDQPDHYCFICNCSAR